MICVLEVVEAHKRGIKIPDKIMDFLWDCKFSLRSTPQSLPKQNQIIKQNGLICLLLSEFLFRKFIGTLEKRDIASVLTSLTRIRDNQKLLLVPYTVIAADFFVCRLYVDESQRGREARMVSSLFSAQKGMN